MDIVSRADGMITSASSMTLSDDVITLSVGGQTSDMLYGAALFNMPESPEPEAEEEEEEEEGATSVATSVLTIAASLMLYLH